MTKKNKHLLKLLSLSLLPIAAISIPAVVLTSCSSGKEESSDNSNNNQPNNPDNNGGEDNTNPGGEGDNGEDNNNPDVTNPTYPTFASADEVRKACDEAKIDSKYESEPTFITTHSNKIGNKENYAVIDIYYPQDEMFGNMNYMYVKISNATNFAPTFSTNFADYPIYAIKDGQKYYINPNKAVLLDKIPELYMLSDEQLKYDSLEVQEVYKKYRNNELWFKVDVSDIKEELKRFLPNSDNYLDWFFIDWNEIPDYTNDCNKGKVSSFLYDERDFYSPYDLWTYRLSNDKRFGLTSIFGLSDFVYMGDTHPVSTTLYNQESEHWNYIDPFRGAVLDEKDLDALKYIQNHPNTVRFIDSITYSAGIKGDDFVLYDPYLHRPFEYIYEKINNKYISFDEVKDTKINYIYKQTADRDFVPSIINIDNKVIYDNVNLLDFQYRQLENGEYLYCPPNTTLRDLLLTFNGGKILGYIPFRKDYDNCKTDSDFLNWSDSSCSSPWFDLSEYYLPDIAFSVLNSFHGFFYRVGDYLYSTYTINFNQPNSK